MSADEVLLERVFSERDVLIKHEFLDFLFGELVDMRPIFENDFDAMLVYTAISRFYLRDERWALADETAQPRLEHGVTAARIAGWTSIPRETVRRKLHRLKERGLLEKGPRGWHVARRDGQPVIRTEYADAWRQELDRIIRLVTALRAHV